MFGNVFRRIAALPLTIKVLLVIAVLIVLGLSIVLSPLVVILAFLALLVAIFALVIRIVRRRPLRTWGLIALTSLLLIIVFSGVTNALYGGGALQQQASSPPEQKEEEPAPAPSEAVEESTVEEPTTAPEPATEATTETASTPPEPEDEEAEDEGDQGGRYDATVTVTRVVDGDTVEISPTVDGLEEVRLIGVDTPETKDPDCAVQPYGSEASRFATNELQGEEIGLEFDQDRADRYGRLLAYVYLPDGEMFNETLLEEGYAQTYIVPPNDQYEDRFRQAQMEAQAAELGIWGLSASEQAQLADRDNGIGSDECQPKATSPPPPPPPPSAPSPAPSPTPASAGGGSFPPISQNACPSNVPIKGNQSGIYHVQGGQFYGRTNPEECFATESDAEAAGYRASQR